MERWQKKPSLKQLTCFGILKTKWKCYHQSKLSRGTVAQRCEVMAEDLTKQLQRDIADSTVYRHQRYSPVVQIYSDGVRCYYQYFPWKDARGERTFFRRSKTLWRKPPACVNWEQFSWLFVTCVHYCCQFLCAIPRVALLSPYQFYVDRSFRSGHFESSSTTFLLETLVFRMPQTLKYIWMFFWSVVIIKQTSLFLNCIIILFQWSADISEYQIFKSPNMCNGISLTNPLSVGL